MTKVTGDISRPDDEQLEGQHWVGNTGWGTVPSAPSLGLSGSVSLHSKGHGWGVTASKWMCVPAPLRIPAGGTVEQGKWPLEVKSFYPLSSLHRVGVRHFSSLDSLMSKQNHIQHR